MPGLVLTAYTFLWIVANGTKRTGLKRQKKRMAQPGTIMKALGEGGM
jgi:hypothetical protein